MDVHPKWFVPVATLIKALRAELADGRADAPYYAHHIAEIGHVYGALDAWRAAGSPKLPAAIG